MAKKKLDYVIVDRKNWGKKLKGIKIFYEGERPSVLKDDGNITFGKYFLEVFQEKFETFEWIITKDKDEIHKEGQKYIIRTSLKTLRKLNSKSFGATHDIRVELLLNEISPLYPSKLASSSKSTYIPGSLSKSLSTSILTKLSEEDKEALDKFIPEYLSKESVASTKISAKTQIKTLENIATEIINEIPKTHAESWWQTYIKSNILLILQGYLYSIEKLNVSFGDTKYPDFLLITHDNFLDILEIKKPSTKLLKKDDSRNNYYWDTEISKAIIQVENYIELISNNSDKLRNFIKDNYNIELKIVRPRGLILAGTSKEFVNRKMKDDYRLLTQANKNISFLNYDELSIRLSNYINVLNGHSKTKKK